MNPITNLMSRCTERSGFSTFALVAAVGVVLLSLGVAELAAQTSVTPGPLASSPQMRHFWHVFAAYAVAWGLIFGWAVAILRRIRSVEARLSALGGEDTSGSAPR